MAVVRGIAFQTVRFPGRQKLLVLLAHRPGAADVEYDALEDSALLYQSGTKLSVRDVFANEESKALAETLGVSKDTIWRIRKAFGVADSYGGGSEVTAWRERKRQTQITRDGSDSVIDFARLEAEYHRLVAERPADARRAILAMLAERVTAVMGADIPYAKRRRQVELAANALFARVHARPLKAAELRAAVPA